MIYFINNHRLHQLKRSFMKRIFIFGKIISKNDKKLLNVEKDCVSILA